jgi:hypothetical protein
MRTRMLGVLTVSLCCLWASAAAPAAPSVRFRAEAMPIAGFPQTGNIEGAGEAIDTEFHISGSEYGGFPPPLIHLAVYLPAGTTLHWTGFPKCAPSTLEPAGTGPRGCPKGSGAGPVGTVKGFVAFGTEIVPETASIQAFYAPGGGLTFFTFGHEPVLLEILSKANYVPASGMFSKELQADVPLVETVPGAQDMSTSLIDVKFGSAINRAGLTGYYLRTPGGCPLKYLPFKAEMTFAGLGGLPEQTVTAIYKAPCPSPGEGSAPESAPQPLPGTGGVVTAPSSNACVSRRDFRVHIVHIGHLVYRLVTVEVNGKPVKVLHGRRQSAQIDLRGLPKGRYVARIAVVTSSGRVLSGTRTYHTCAAHPIKPHGNPRL